VTSSWDPCRGIRPCCSGSARAHGFKFAPTFGRLLADLVTSGATSSDVAAFAADRPALVDADYPVSWLV